MRSRAHCPGFTLLELMIVCVCGVVLFGAATELMFALSDAAEQDVARYTSTSRSWRVVERIQADVREATTFAPGIAGGFMIQAPAVNADGDVIDGADTITYFMTRSMDGRLVRAVIPCAGSAREETRQCVAAHAKHLSATMERPGLVRVDLQIAGRTRRGDASGKYSAMVSMRNYREERKP